MLKDQILIEGVFTDSQARALNTTGTPLSLITANAEGESPLGGVYDITFENVVAGVSADCIVTPQNHNNPFGGTFAVSLDDATDYALFGGAKLRFSDAGGFANNWAATVFIGGDFGTILNAGASANVPSAGVRHKVVNTGAGDYADCQAELLKIVKHIEGTGNVFSFVAPFADDAAEKTDGTTGGVTAYILKIADTAGAGAGKTCSLLLDDDAFPAASIRDLTTGGAQNGTLLKAIAGQAYKIESGDLSGLVFEVAPECADDDTARVLIFNPRYSEIAPDDAGAAGEYGTAAVVLTEDGEAEGVITPSGAAYFWHRITVPFAANAYSNPYPVDVAISGTISGGI